MATALITGSTDGLGRRVAERLVERGDTVLVHGRDPDKLERVAREVGAERAYLADLGSLAEVRRLADEVSATPSRLDALVNNAGIGVRRAARERGRPRARVRRQLPGRLRAHDRLLPLLGDRSRAHRQRRLDRPARDRLRRRDARARLRPVRSYAQSKLAQIMFTIELAERLGDRASGRQRCTRRR